MEPEETPEPDAEVTPEVDPDDTDIDYDSDDIFDNDHVKSDELLAARGGEQKFRWSDFKDEKVGGKLQSLFRHMGTSRTALREREAKIAAEDARIAAADKKFKEERATWASTLQGQLLGKGAPKATPQGAKPPAGTVVAGKGAQTPDAGGWKMPSTQEEFDALVEARAKAALAEQLGGFATAESEAAKKAEAEAATQTTTRWRQETNSWFDQQWAKGPKNADVAAKHAEAKELLPVLYKNGLGAEMAGRSPWYSDFALRIAGHEHIVPMMTLFGNLPREGLYKRKPAEVVAYLEAQGRELGLVPPLGKVSVPKETLDDRVAAGERPDKVLSKRELDKIQEKDIDRWMRLLADNPDYLKLYPEGRAEA